MSEQRYRVTGVNRNSETINTGGEYQITAPTGLDFFHVDQQHREKGKRKWNTTESYYATANKGRVASITCHPMRNEADDVPLDSDKGVTIAAEIARFYADTNTPKENNHV